MSKSCQSEFFFYMMESFQDLRLMMKKLDFDQNTHLVSVLIVYYIPFSLPYSCYCFVFFIFGKAISCFFPSGFSKYHFGCKVKHKLMNEM